MAEMKNVILAVGLFVALGVGYKAWENHTAKQLRCARYRVVLRNWTEEENFDSDLHRKRVEERTNALHSIQEEGCPD